MPVDKKDGCPVCGYPQECPCVACKPNRTKGIKPWVWKHGCLIACAGCGYTAHVDNWEFYLELFLIKK